MVGYFSIVLALILFKVWWDKRAKDSGRVINHFKSAAIDTAFYCFFAGAFFWREPFYNVGGFILTALSLRWILFDLVFNFVNGWEWDHLGDSSELDKLMKLVKHPILVKLAFLIIGVVLCLI